MVAVYKFSEMSMIVKSALEGILQQYENPALRKSKFVFDRVLRMGINFHRLNLTRGSSCIELPDWLASKKAIINPRNSDNQCFKWVVIAGIYANEIGRDCQRVSKLRKYENEFDWYGIDFPTSYKDIRRFECVNEITVNMLAVEDRKIYICRKGKEYNRVVNLMLITEGNRKHYITIKSLSRLLSRLNSKHKQSQHFCTNCLQGFSTETSRDKHYYHCKDHEAVRIEVPKNSIVEYCDGQCQFKVPFIMYADFESILEPIQRVTNNPEISSTRGINVHVPSGWCVCSKFAYGDNVHCVKYRGIDSVSKFCAHTISEASRLYKSHPEVFMIPLTNSQMKEYSASKECHICFKRFNDKDRKVRDHCHYTGLYRGAAHSSCNLQYKIPSYVPVIFHNLADYDAHLFIKELASYTTDISVIAKNTEDYISFGIKVGVDKYVDKFGVERVKELEL